MHNVKPARILARSKYIAILCILPLIHEFISMVVTVVGIPAISIPVRLSEDNLPLSMQLITSHFDEHTLLNTAKFIEDYVQFPRLFKDMTLDS